MTIFFWYLNINMNIYYIYMDIFIHIHMAWSSKSSTEMIRMQIRTVDASSNPKRRRCHGTRRPLPWTMRPRWTIWPTWEIRPTWTRQRTKTTPIGTNGVRGTSRPTWTRQRTRTRQTPIGTNGGVHGGSAIGVQATPTKEREFLDDKYLYIQTLYVFFSSSHQSMLSFLTC